MNLGSKILLSALIGAPVLVVFLVFLSMGPAGWFAAAFLVLGGMAFVARRDDGADLPDRTNCAACGSPNPADAESCDYCGEPI